MKTTTSQLAILTLALVCGALALPSKPQAAEGPAKPQAADGAEKTTPQSVFAGTAIGVVLEANDNEVPRNGEEMMKILAKFGDVAQLPVTFSAVAMDTGLAHPRVVLAFRPSLTTPGFKPPADDPDADPLRNGGVPVLTTIGTAKLTKPSLEGRLYLAANMGMVDGKLKVKTFEFISWNSRKKRFDFGFIECDPVEPQIRVVDGVKCFSCHKNKGPILGQGPWSNTTHNDVMRAAVTQRLRLPDNPLSLIDRTSLTNFQGLDIGQPRRLDTGMVCKPADLPPPIKYDGMSVFLPQGPAVDASVRLGAEVLRDREIFKLMGRTNGGRKGLVILFTAAVLPGEIRQNNAAMQKELNREFNYDAYAPFAERVQTIHKTTSSTLADFNPSGSQGKLVNVVTSSPGGWGSGPTLQSDLRIVWSGDVKQVVEYDQKRAGGNPNLPSRHQPSNPRAFVFNPSPPLPPVPSAAINAMMLARVIGLTEGDRAYIGAKLTEAAERVNKPKVTPATLAKEVFTGPQFEDVLKTGDIPDREDFKDRFVKGLDAVLRNHGAVEFKLDRRDYASGVNVALAPGFEDREPPLVVTSACFRCHEMQKLVKQPFTPIPRLAFDPFDAANRDAWVKATDPKQREQIIARMLRRLAEDKDMPPEDSPEYEQLRAKNPAQFDAVKDWLEAELKRAATGK